MNLDEIKLLFAYNDWANQRILTTTAKVTEEQYLAPTTNGWGSLRGTLVHTLDSMWGWRAAFQNFYVSVATPRDQWPPARAWDTKEYTEADWPTLDALTAHWQLEEQALQTYLNGLSDQDLNGLVRYQITGGIVRERLLWHCLLHLANHGTQHRSEAAAILTSYGQSPGDLDMTVFYNAYFNLPSPS